MRKQPARRVSKRLLAFLSAAALLGTLLSAPWWWPWLLWRHATTSFVTVGAGVYALDVTRAFRGLCCVHLVVALAAVAPCNHLLCPHGRKCASPCC